MPPPWTCSNGRFWTDTSEGEPHGEGRAKGSVFAGPVAGAVEGNSLWLEHIIDSRAEEGSSGKAFWFMWYDKNGRPTINTSAVFSETDLREVMTRLRDFPRGLDGA